MGQFKPMVKMETTEPSVTLHLKRGGSATHERAKAEGGRVPSGMMGSKAIKHGGKAVKKADGGALSMMAPAMGNPAAARAMAARRMMKGAPPMGPTAQTGRPPMAMPAGAMARPPMMKEGGKVDMAQDKAMIKKAFKQHDMQEHKGGKGTTLKLKKGGDAMCEGGMPKGKYATGGVVKGNAGGYKTGGIAMSNAGGYKDGGIIMSKSGDTKMVTSKADHAPAKTGGVRMGNAGGYKRGGTPVKKLARGGSVQDDGAAVKMPQGRKAPSSPVAISKLSGTFKRGGEVC
jgi:hypothetical protein